MAHEQPPRSALGWYGLIALLCLWVSAPTHAYYLPLVFVPAQPAEGEIGTVIVSVGACDALAAGAHLNRLLTVEGTIVRIELRGVTSFFSPAISQQFRFRSNWSHCRRAAIRSMFIGGNSWIPPRLI